jgi:tight adherence protein C
MNMFPILLAGFLFVALLLVLVAVYRSSNRYAVQERLERIRESETQTPEEELEQPFFQRVILPLGEVIFKLGRGFSPSEMTDSTQKKLVMAGLYPKVTPAQIQGLCLASAVLFAVLLMTVYSVPWKQWQPIQALYVVGALIGGFMVPQFVLSRKVRERQEQIMVALPYSIDLLSISVEAGMGFDQAVGYVMRKTKGPLAQEFSRTLNEIRLGKPRLEALEDLGNRTGAEDLKTFVSAVVHASRLGSSITNTLRVQADSMRVRRRQRAQEQAMKAPIKLVFPLVFCIFPALFVVILGPPLISIFTKWL